MPEIEEIDPAEESLTDLSVTQLKKRMKERGIDASGCTEVRRERGHTAPPASPARRHADATLPWPSVRPQKSDLIKRLNEPGEHQRAVASSSTDDAAAAPAAAEEMPDVSAQLGQMGRQMVMLPALWMSNKIDFEDKSNVQILQATFFVVLLVAVGLLQLTLAKIEAAKDGARVQKPGDSQHFTKAEDGSVSVQEYDSAKAKETRSQLIMGGAIVTFLHFKFGYIQPLLMTSLMNVFNLYDCKAVLIHLLGATVERPWTPPASANPLQQWAERKKAEAEEMRKEAEAEAAKKSE